ncbi:hypothetical protein RAVI111496_24285 [Rahnella victoriana]
MHAVIENQFTVMAFAIGVEEAVVADRAAILHVDDQIIADTLVAGDGITRGMHAYDTDLIEGDVLAGI